MLEIDKTALIVIDIQDKLMPNALDRRETLIARTVKLIQCARALGIPVLVTEQNPQRLGGTNARVAETLEGVARLAKIEFGCMGNEAFRDALAASGRPQLLLAGMETHICVMQTALGAREAGYEVFVARDAVASMDAEEKEAGLDRMARAGVTLCTVQMAIFEWLRAAGTPEFRSLLPYLK
jgi:nicotinamidase-related amidase